MNKFFAILLILVGLVSINKTFAASENLAEISSSVEERQILSEATRIGVHLLLNLDVNGVLVPIDTVQGKTEDDIIYANLAENVSALWKAPLYLPEGSMLPEEWGPPTKRVSYDQYVKKYLLSYMQYEAANLDATDMEIDVVKKRNDIAKKEYQKFFYTHFLENLSISDNPTRTVGECDEIITTTKSSLEDQQGIVVESFYHVINWLREVGISFSIVLRSFGTDTEDVLEEIGRRARLSQEVMLKFKGESLVDMDENPVSQTFSQTLRSLGSETISSVQCDYDYWHHHGHEEKEAFGKPVIISTLEKRDERSVISIFFDDNLVQKEIGCPVFEEGVPSVSVAELIERGIFVPVDTLEVINNPNYFKEKILKAMVWNLTHRAV